MKRVHLKSGQATLTTVLLIGTLTVFVGASLTFLVFRFLNASFGFQASERAFAAASGGKEDALLRLARDKTFEAPGGYTVSVGAYQATVTVTQNSPVAGEATILSRAIVSGYERKLETIVSIDTRTGEVSVRESHITL